MCNNIENETSNKLLAHLKSIYPLSPRSNILKLFIRLEADGKLVAACFKHVIITGES